MQLKIELTSFLTNMAAEEDQFDLEEDTPVEPKGKKAAKHDSGAADLEKVTDYVEETEITSQNIGDVSNDTLCIEKCGIVPALSPSNTWERHFGGILSFQHGLEMSWPNLND